MESTTRQIINSLFSYFKIKKKRETSMLTIIKSEKSKRIVIRLMKFD